jgi:predicted phosphohydrolase
MSRTQELLQFALRLVDFQPIRSMQIFQIVLLGVLIVFSVCGPIPTQIHVAFTGKQSEMSIMWSTPLDFDLTNEFTVRYGVSKANLDKIVIGKPLKYRSKGSYESLVHEAILTDLPPRSLVYYQVGLDTTWSDVHSFETMVDDQYRFKFLTYGDMDINDAGQDTIKNVLRRKDYNFILHQGDMPYAWEEDKWDIWFNLMQPITSNTQYMVCPGNHEEAANFTSYKHRFSNSSGINSGSNSNLFYSWEYSNVHFIALSTEHNYKVGSEQLNWLIKDLSKIDRVKTPFIIVYQHRPMYSSNRNHGSSLEYRAQVEEILVDAKVDLLLFGHVHAYERTCPVFNGKCFDYHSNYHFHDVQGPIHVCTGTAGYTLNTDWEEPIPNWSIFRDASHGITEITVSKTSIFIQYFRNGDLKPLDSFMISKTIPNAWTGV